MADEEETHGTIENLDKKNFIKTKNGIQKGFIDTIIFNDYQTLIVIAKQKGQQIADLKLGQDALSATIPCTYRNGFQRELKIKKTILDAKKTGIDANGFARLKFKISNKKINRKSEKDFDWNAFVLRIQADENWEIQGIRLFKGQVKREIWLNV
jgi:hypothetical protein